jgi:hypothetical protein
MGGDQEVRMPGRKSPRSNKIGRKMNTGIKKIGSLRSVIIDTNNRKFNR